MAYKTKELKAAHNKRWKEANKERVQELAAKYKADGRYKGRYKGRYRSSPSAATKSQKSWRSRNPIKTTAHRAVFVAMRNKTLKREPCLICGGEDVQAHHYDYRYPLAVIWLCKLHHIAADKIRKDFEAKIAL